MMCLTLFSVKRCLKDVVFLFQTICKDAKKSLKSRKKSNYLQASSIATAQATVIPTMGLLPAPIRPQNGFYTDILNSQTLNLEIFY